MFHLTLCLFGSFLILLVFAFSAVWSSLIVYGSCIFALCVIQVSMLRPREGYGLNPKLRFFEAQRGMFYHIWTIFPSPGKRIWPKSYRKIQVPHLCQYRPCPALAPSVQTLITAGVFCISCLKLCLQFWRQFFIVFRFVQFTVSSLFRYRLSRIALILFTRIVKNSRVKGAYHSHKPPGWKCYA